MATTIAVSGKGGSGKTTLAAMTTRLLLERTDKKSVIVVDADPNACLGLTLGVEPEITVADIREEIRAKGAGNTGMDKVRSVEYGIQQAITEAKGFDLLTMGRPEGPSCYCAVNNMLRKFMDQLDSQYDFVIIDNEAGMEHLSRRTTNNVDLLCIVAEQNTIGTLTAQRIFDLSKKLPIAVKKTGIIWNRSENDKEIDGIDNFGHIPYDKAVFDASMQDKTVFDLANDCPAFSMARKILEDIGILVSSS
ncbi:MAG: AAA family ATPase [Planctomycetes bacterium]|nr:AAA family ATPase [Planctomycetota bacterium]MBL7143637.1 AAA family ATPase [Phycisphaerae bacterium]